VNLAGVDQADVSARGDMGGTVVVRRLDAAFYDAYGKGIMGVARKGMPDEGGVQELQSVKIGGR
jgi:hypothetical protein